jgi:hypothetical protein
MYMAFDARPIIREQPKTNVFKEADDVRMNTKYK